MRKYYSIDLIVTFLFKNLSRSSMCSIVREDIGELLIKGSQLLNSLKFQYKEMNFIENINYEIYVSIKQLNIKKHTRLSINNIEFKKLLLDFEILSYNQKLEQILPTIDTYGKVVSVDELDFDSYDDIIIIYKPFKQLKRKKDLISEAIDKIEKKYNYNAYEVLQSYV